MRYIVKSKKNCDGGYCYCGWLALVFYRCTPQCSVLTEDGCVTAYCSDFRFV